MNRSRGGNDVDTDVVVVGAGAAGLMAALAAADAGARVLILEKDLSATCSTQLSAGVLMAAGTPEQAALGVADTAELYAQDIAAYNHQQSDPFFTLSLCQRSAAVIDVLKKKAGLEFRVDRDYLYHGHSVPRGHTAGGGGKALLDAMRSAVATRSDITVLDHQPVSAIDVRDGAVWGVSTSGKEWLAITCKSVVLATGGFEANSSMVAELIPEVADARYIGASTETGDGIRLAVDLGASTRHMGSYLAHAHVCADSGERLPGAIPLHGGIVVNVDGKRFAAEDLSPPRFAPYLLRQPGSRALEIFDERVWDLVSRRDGPARAVRPPCVASASTVGELARNFGLDPIRVSQEFENYNTAAAKGLDSFGRSVFGETLRPPFLGAMVTVGFACTQGGLVVDATGRVLDRSGSAIPNLFAAGATCAGLSGDSGSTGYLPGNGLLLALGLGMISGESSAVNQVTTAA